MRHTERCVGNGRHAGRLAQAVVDTLPDSLAEVSAETQGDTLSDAQGLVDTPADIRKQWSTRWPSQKHK